MGCCEVSGQTQESKAENGREIGKRPLMAVDIRL